jgi:hypothetical protein
VRNVIRVEVGQCGVVSVLDGVEDKGRDLHCVIREW